MIFSFNELTELQSIIMGERYNEKLIKKAIDYADSLESRICLQSLIKGTQSFSSRMVCQDFVVRLTQQIKVSS